jgi:hypothetical protein
MGGDLMERQSLLTAAEIEFILLDCAQAPGDGVDPVERHRLSPPPLSNGDASRLAYIRHRMAIGRPIPASWIRWLFEKYVDV